MDLNITLKLLLEDLADGNRAGSIRNLKELLEAIDQPNRLLPVAQAAKLLNRTIAFRILIEAHQVPEGEWFHKRTGVVRYQMLDYQALDFVWRRYAGDSLEGATDGDVFFTVTDDGRVNPIKKDHKVYVYPPNDWWNYDAWVELLSKLEYIEDDGDNWVQIREFETCYPKD